MPIKMSKRKAKKSQRASLEEQLFIYFHEGKDQVFLEKAFHDAGIPDHKANEVMGGHYYLSPLNLITSQKLLAMLTVFLAVTITAIRANTDWVLVGISLVCGLSLGLPFLATYLIMRKLEELAALQKLAVFALVYALFLAALFALIAFNTGIYGASLIPVLILILYVLELRKLLSLRRKLAGHQNKR